MFRLFAFLVGFGFTILGNIYIICYLNLMSLGYNLTEYVKFISKRFECLIGLIGLIIIILVIFIPTKEEKNELYI